MVTVSVNFSWGKPALMGSCSPAMSVLASFLVELQLFKQLLMGWLGSGDLSYFVKTNLSCNHCHEFIVKNEKAEFIVESLMACNEDCAGR